MQRENQHEYVALGDGCADTEGARPSSADGGRTSSFSQTCFNCCSLLLGMAMLASPYAVQKAGWSILLTGFVCVPVVYFYSAVLLKRCLEKHVELRSYEDISEKAYGKTGLKVFTALFLLEIYATLVSYGVSLEDNLVQIVVEQMGVSASSIWGNRWFLMGIALLVVMPSVWLRNLRTLSMMSIGSTISAVAVIFSVVWLAVSHDVEFSDSRLVVARPLWFPVSISIYLFCYSGHVVLPSVYVSMQDKTKFTKAITVSFSVATVCYAGLGLLGALMFGDAIESQVTLNLPQQYAASVVAIWLTVIVPITKFALLMSPLSAAAERQIPWSPTTKKHGIAAIIMRSCLTASVFLVALIFPFFSYVLALIGATISVALCVVCPCLFYLRLMGRYLSTFEKLTCAGLVVLSSFVGVTCTVFSVKNCLVT